MKQFSITQLLLTILILITAVTQLIFRGPVPMMYKGLPEEESIVCLSVTMTGPERY